MHTLLTAMGGGSYSLFAANLNFNPLRGRVQNLNASTTGLKVILPNALTLDLGLKVYILCTTVSAYNIVYNDGVTVVKAAGAFRCAVLSLADKSTVNGKWIGFVVDLWHLGRTS